MKNAILISVCFSLIALASDPFEDPLEATLSQRQVYCGNMLISLAKLGVDVKVDGVSLMFREQWFADGHHGKKYFEIEIVRNPQEARLLFTEGGKTPTDISLGKADVKGLFSLRGYKDDLFPIVFFNDSRGLGRVHLYRADGMLVGSHLFDIPIASIELGSLEPFMIKTFLVSHDNSGKYNLNIFQIAFKPQRSVPFSISLFDTLSLGLTPYYVTTCSDPADEKNRIGLVPENTGGKMRVFDDETGAEIGFK